MVNKNQFLIELHFDILFYKRMKRFELTNFMLLRFDQRQTLIRVATNLLGIPLHIVHTLFWVHDVKLEMSLFSVRLKIRPSQAVALSLQLSQTVTQCENYRGV